MNPQRDIHRILDANLNRAREALRVAEETARFVLERPALADAAKRMRHDLRAAAERLDARRLITARDTAGDVGTGLVTDGETTREGAGEVCRAACKRLTEALRVLEEYGKTLSADFAAGVETIRYRAYDLERRLAEALEPAGLLAKGGVCVLLTKEICRRPWQEVLEGTLDGGAGCIQLREKHLPDTELALRARLVVQRCDRAGAISIVNDRPDVAAACGADGVHVGQDDLPPRLVRRVVGPDRIVGVSTHSVEQARAASEAGADCIGVGPMFATGTKPRDVIPGPDLVRRVREAVGLPIFAIGGITAERAPEVAAAGTHWLAVSAAVCRADDPKAATRALVESLSER